MVLVPATLLVPLLAAQSRTALLQPLLPAAHQWRLLSGAALAACGSARDGEESQETLCSCAATLAGVFEVPGVAAAIKGLRGALHARPGAAWEYGWRLQVRGQKEVATCMSSADRFDTLVARCGRFNTSVALPLRTAHPRAINLPNPSLAASGAYSDPGRVPGRRRLPLRLPAA